MTTIMSVEERQREQKYDFIDGMHSILKCSNCGMLLADIWLVKDGPQFTKFRAQCAECGDHSEIHDAKGQVCVGVVEESAVTPSNFTTKTIGGAEVNIIETVKKK
jgi:predicted amino acid dehydrogenase